MIEAKGHTGSILFDGNFITIQRKGVLAKMTVGKGEKRIPIKSVSAVQWKPAGIMVNGYIEFSLSGGNESRSKFGSATNNAVQNENAVLFTRKQMPSFEGFKAEVEQAIIEQHGLSKQTGVMNQSVASLIKELEELRQNGLLTEEEYGDKKTELLRRM